MSRSCGQVIDHVTELVKTAIVKEMISPQELMVAIHNAFVHGEILEKVGYSVDDEQLGRLFDHFEALMQEAKELD